MSKRAKEFQKATADRIEEIFREGKQKRVLLADEVGLGKTIIAREVIDRVRQIRSDVHDDMFRVVYVCSNINIVHQNTKNLGMQKQLDISESRLSMQHLIIHEEMAALKEEGKYREDGIYEEGMMPELLIPLTPGTSLTMSSGYGNMNERALMYNILIRMDELKEHKGFLNRFCQFYPKLNQKNWNWYVNAYSTRVEKCGDDYISKMHNRLFRNELFLDCYHRLIAYIENKNKEWNEKSHILNRLRVAFAQVSIEELEPDFVIMDEFQRFSSLIDDNEDDESEQTMLTKKFFGEMSGENAPLILLLSATPYKPYSTLEDLNETNCDQEYEDFLKLTNFLFTGEKAAEFKEVWKDYSTKLSQLNTDTFSLLLASKEHAEKTMYSAICRTERLSNSIIDTTSNVQEVPISEGDILAYCQMQKMIRNCQEKMQRRGKKFLWTNTPMEYVKSAPYLLSFMENYKLKEDIMKCLRNGKNTPIKLPFRKGSQQILINLDKVYNYKELPANNARLDSVKKILFNKEKQSQCLLWIPASHPYYKTDDTNVFRKNRDFSKILVFSSWEMVPRMMAFMLSYEQERLTIPCINHRREEHEPTYTNKTGAQRLRAATEGHAGTGKQLLEYASPYLASIYKPEESYGQDIEDIRGQIIEELYLKIKTLSRGKNIEEVTRCSSTAILKIAQWLDGIGNCPEEIPERTYRILADMAIGSPSICLYRRIGENVSDVIERSKDGDESTLASQFTGLFNLRQSAGIMDQLYGDNGRYYFENVLDYCVMGDMQAMLDEFIHMIDESGENIKNIVETIYGSFVGVSTSEFDTTDSFYYAKRRYRLRTHYSMTYTNTKVDERNVSRAINVRMAFNSPFHPFVLTSTSIGQEGLDFHWYCRKIVHWNIPANPQDIEQREGRINRYKCLAIRRNLANKYKGIFDWKKIFDSAYDDMKNSEGGLVPYWCLPVEEFDHPEMIERIVPLFPLSSDRERYQHMEDVLALYRLTMGQPRQEELLSLFREISQDQVMQLLFNLSPIKRINIETKK